MDQVAMKKSSTAITSKLLTSAINYHGQELLNALKTEQEEAVLNAVDARAINYVQYHHQAQQQELHLRAKKQKFLQFLARKAHLVFVPFKGELPIMPDIEAINQFAVLPPMEEAMAVPASERRRLFFQNLDQGDYVIGHLKTASTCGYFVNLLCLDGGKKMFIHDLGIKALLLSRNFSAAYENFPVKIGDLIRASVAAFTRNTQKVMLSITNDIKKTPKMKLGVITDEEMPSHYRGASGKQLEFNKILEQDKGFLNPCSVQNLCTYFGISNSDISSSSLMKCLSNVQFPEEECASYLCKVQSSQWAATSIAQGVSYSKEKKYAEAFQCFSNALKIDNTNIEALIGRGAVYANLKSLKKAIEDFEKALSLDPSNHYAKNYLSDTRLVVGKILAQKGDVDGSLENLRKSLELNEDNQDASELLKAVINVKKIEQSKVATKLKANAPVSNSILDTRTRLKNLIDEEQKMKIKKKHSSVPLCSSSVSSHESGNSSHDNKRKRSLSKEIDDAHKLLCEQFLESNRKRLEENHVHVNQMKRHKKHLCKEESSKYDVRSKRVHKSHESVKIQNEKPRKHSHRSEVERYEVKSDRVHRTSEGRRHETERHPAKSHSENVKRKMDIELHSLYEHVESDHKLISHKKHIVDSDVKIKIGENYKNSAEKTEYQTEVQKRFERDLYPDHFPCHPDITPGEEGQNVENRNSALCNKKEEPGFLEQSKQKVFFVLRSDQDNKSINKGLLRDNSVAHCFRDDSDEELCSELKPETSKKPLSLFKKPSLFLPRKYRSNRNDNDDEVEEKKDLHTSKLQETALKGNRLVLDEKIDKRTMSQQHCNFLQSKNCVDRYPEKCFSGGKDLKLECHYNLDPVTKRKLSALPSRTDRCRDFLISESFHRNKKLKTRSDSKFSDKRLSSDLPKANTEPCNGKLQQSSRKFGYHSEASTSAVAPHRLSAVDVFKHDLMKF